MVESKGETNIIKWKQEGMKRDNDLNGWKDGQKWMEGMDMKEDRNGTWKDK